MKITNTQLKRIIKEELSKVLNEGPADLPTPEQVWEREGSLRDIDDVYLWLNNVQRAFPEFAVQANLGDQYETNEIEDGLMGLGISLPIEDLETALKVFHAFAAGQV